MAKIQCTLEIDGRLKVLRVIEFQPGDTIELDEPVEVAWHVKHGTPPVITKAKCAAVLTPFIPSARAVENIIPNPCPPN